MNKPKVVIYTVATIDGRVTIAPDTTAFELLADDRWKEIDCVSKKVRDFLWNEHKPTVWLEGIYSFINSRTKHESLPKYKGNIDDLYNDFIAEHLSANKLNLSWCITTDSKGRGRWPIKTFKEVDGTVLNLLILVSNSTPPEYLAYLREEKISYLVTGEGQVDLAKAFEKLKIMLGVNCILSYAGGKLNGALLRAGLIDEINIEFIPAVIGGKNIPILYESPNLLPGEKPVKLKLVSAEVLYPEETVWVRYQILKE
ncbi:MAG: hypothetical protein FK731_03360 [Asgard group archaeon]|nr:hypothetical protein [Asgard group archaeon]